MDCGVLQATGLVCLRFALAPRDAQRMDVEELLSEILLTRVEVGNLRDDPVRLPYFLASSLKQEEKTKTTSYKEVLTDLLWLLPRFPPDRRDVGCSVRTTTLLFC